MLLLGMLGILMLSLSLCDAGDTCPPMLEPVITAPNVTEFGNEVLLNCSVEQDTEEIILLLGNEETINMVFNSFVYRYAPMKSWDMKTECKVKLNDSFECSKEFEIILYQMPAVHLSVKENNTLAEKTRYTLQCDIFNAAPVQNLTVSWYKNDNITVTMSFSETTKTPVNTSKVWEVSITREENIVQFRCEAQLELGPEGPQHPVVSQTHDLSALYAPEFRANHRDHMVVSEGDDVSLTCEADGNPPPEYQWTVDGTELLENSDTLNILEINNSANYSCTASNKLGSRTLSVYVEVPEVTTTAAPAVMPFTEDLTSQEISEVLLSIKTSNVLDKATLYTLQCVVVSAAAAHNLSVRWYKNDKIMKPFYESVRTSVNTSSNLNVSITREENVVQFRCEAQLEPEPEGPQHPVVSQTHNLSALYAPEFRTNHSGHMVVSEGDDVSLTCEADGNPPPEYQWTIDGIKLLENSDTLNITQINNSANYSCTASNKLGSRTLNVYVEVPEVTTTAAPAVVYLFEATTPQACSLTLMPSEVVVKFGDPVKLNCSTSVGNVSKIGWESSAGTIEPKPSSVVWSIDKLEDWTLDPFCFVTLDSELQCTAYPVITLYKTPDLISVSVLDHIMKEGATYQMKCNIHDVAPLNKLVVKWYHGDKIISTERFNSSSVTSQNVSSNLTIIPERSINGSLFRCEAELHLGPKGPELPPTTASEPFVAVVHYKPVIKTCQRKLTVAENTFKLQDLSCEIDANPPPAVQWYHHAGKPVRSDEPLKRNDSGNYTAEVFNSVGKAYTYVFITVEYIPSFTCEMHHQVEANDKPKPLCDPKAIPPPSVKWFQNGKEIELPPRWTKHHSGNYLIRAHNKLGTAEHKIYVDVLYAPEFKEGNASRDLIPGRNVTFNCSAEGNPDPEIEWTYKPAHNLKETTEGRQKIITVTGATSTNIGPYSCTATNKVGNVTRTVTLMERGKTSSFLISLLLIPLVLIISLVVVYCLYSKKKKGQYIFVSNADKSFIPMSTNSAAACRES